jgi:hypothetical protein
MRPVLADGEAPNKKPIRGAFFGCCASARFTMLRIVVAAMTATSFLTTHPPFQDLPEADPEVVTRKPETA